MSVEEAIKFWSGSWVTKLPGYPTTGDIELLDDHRIRWAESQIGPWEGSDILELGSLEGAHTAMMCDAGANSVLAIEGNRQAHQRSLIVQQLYQLDRATFACEQIESLDLYGKWYDQVIACGVLYHQSDPVWLLRRLAAVTDRLYVWSHYFDHYVMTREQLEHFAEPVEFCDGQRSYGGMLRRYSTGEQRRPSFCGHPLADTSVWLTKESLLQATRDAGFSTVVIEVDETDHPNGPAISFCALR